MVAPLQAQSVRVELDQRRDHVVEGQDVPALLLPARRLGVRRPFNEAGLTCRDAVERSPLIV